MADTQTYTLSLYDRLQLVFQVIPAEGGSLREAIRINRLRKALKLTEDEKEAIEYSEANGSPQFNGELLDQQPSTDCELSPGEAEVIALGFKQMDDRGRVPTNDAFIELYEKFADIVEDLDV